MRLTITKQIGLLFFLPLCGILATIGFFRSIFVQTATHVPFVNAAGSQRMVSEQLCAYARMVCELGQEEDRGGLRALVAAYERSLGVLEKGGQVKGHSLLPAPPEVQDEVAGVKRLWRDLKPALLLVADRPVGDPQTKQAYALIRPNIPLLTAASSQVVEAFEEWNDALQRRMLLMLVVLAGIDFALLLSALWIIKRYVAERKRVEKGLLESERRRVLLETAGAAAHEINQPLTAIVGLTQLLLMDTASFDDQLRGDIEKIHQAGQEVREIVRKMESLQEYVTRPYTKGFNIVDFDAASQRNA